MTESQNNELKAWQRLQKRFGYYHGQSPGIGPSFSTDTQGYEVWHTNKSPDGYNDFRVHRLVAIVDGADPHKVFAGEKYNIHHKNGITWDNRPENLELVPKVEHSRYHALDRIEKGEFPIGGKSL